MSQKPLRFAALIRVSTEKQEKKNESLRVQTKQIAHAVESLGGSVTKHYAGQEHATPGYERQQLEKLLADAARSRKPFDAVMVATADRWSRDNAKSKAGLQAFRDNDIRFFTLTQEHDLYDPSVILFLGMAAEIGEYQARQQKLKSALSCIERAKRIGAPSSGRKPYGRTWDRNAEKWGIDEEKKAKIEDVAKRYLAGEPLPKLAEEHGFNHSFLNKTLAESCGNSYSITWDIKDLNIRETVEIKIPRLLPDRTIKALRKKAEANRTYQHGKPKYQYLLSGYVFCGECGYSMLGQANHKTTLYYRHKRRSRARECPHDPSPYVRADLLEDAVIRHLFDTFGNPKGVEKAIEAATPNLKKLREYRDQMTKLEADLAKVERSRNTILNLIVKDATSEEEAEAQLGRLKKREEDIGEQIERLALALDNSPTPEHIKATANEVVKRFTKPKVSAKRRLKTREANNLETMSWEDKRALIELVFNGHGPDGRPMGVYVDPIDGQERFREKQWAFTLNGIAPVNGDTSVTQCAWGSPGKGLRQCHSRRRAPRLGA